GRRHLGRRGRPRRRPRRRGRACPLDPGVPVRRAPGRVRHAPAAAVLHERQRRPRAGRPAHGGQPRGRRPPGGAGVSVGTTEERIRADLERYLGEPVHAVRVIPEGHSGFTYWVDLDGRRAVMRLPPPTARIAGPADIPRQGRLIDALHRQGLPVPAVLRMTDEPAVDGRPFYLLEAVDGERTA